MTKNAIDNFFGDAVVWRQNRPLYGIWISGDGWLKISDDYFVDWNKDRIEEICKNIGGSHIRYIDANPIVNRALEELYLKSEKRSLCHYFNKFWQHKTSK